MKVFVDTSAWLALADRTDQYHFAAQAKLKLVKKVKAELYTSDYIFDESITLLRYRVSHIAALELGDKILCSTLVDLLTINQSLCLAAWDLFRKYKDKELSYTDCTSFSLIKAEKINKAFSFDKHFTQCGFELL